ncbi:Formamidopyrimidine-DNA glycosylase N-terminal domain-containing protein [Annulohypoxylon maeteangense]|uniref:Formamidopyrimidine-DNA glycosylase N-terminal domain-containing protein n=1 Tax=Annulohypoxylon maeteangense TaxID=1927788 RepID=UPI00200808EE|nr:Formamidopyrimidine-DNA glycosylase N-terminal domain-containing protein [Annulohypoxylon maeteangense]KAI0887902.1 Formamidopyrimidine-DNA glycosylase N-terminal domain-containing protein [Annulohypoxylon maeteangense]
MPEIAEVARIVHFLRQHLIGKTIKKVLAPDDSSIFGKVGTSGPAFEKALTGKKVVDIGSQGKYFWMVFSAPPHTVLHLGMTGWVEIKGIQTGYSRYVERTKGDTEWPPKFWKFQFETDDDPKVEVAYTDARRFGRVRLVDCPGNEIRKHSPLVENGPDPVVDKDIFTEDFLRQKLRKKHVPIKALLLDQSMISGIGNWVGDEVLYQAKLHPGQYCDDFDDADINALYKAIQYVCETAVEKLGDSDQFPEDWLFKHRWGKGKKGSPTTLPNGDKIIHITVGGRTSCVVPNIQKIKGRTAKDGAKEELTPPEEEKATESRFFKGKNKKPTNSDVEAEERPVKKARTAKSKPVKQEEEEEIDEEEIKPAAKTSRKSAKPKKEEKPVEPVPELGRRRSTRLSRAAA